jgi:hypothetical protein
MKNLFGKFALTASLFILTFSSCKKEEALKGEPNSYTTFEVYNVAKINTFIQVDGRIGEKVVTNNIIPRMTITRTDEKGVKGIVYDQYIVALAKPPLGLTFTPLATYGRETNKVYGFSLLFPVEILGKGVKGTTNITIDIWDATKIIATFNTTNLDYNIKL